MLLDLVQGQQWELPPPLMEFSVIVTEIYNNVTFRQV